MQVASHFENFMIPASDASARTSDDDSDQSMMRAEARAFTAASEFASLTESKETTTGLDFC